MDVVLTYMTAVVVVLGALGLVFGALLAVAHRFLHVERDLRLVMIEKVLPGFDCGACGYGGCAAYAEVVVQGKAPPDLCKVGGPEVASRIAEAMLAGKMLGHLPGDNCCECLEESCADYALALARGEAPLSRCSRVDPAEAKEIRILKLAADVESALAGRGCRKCGYDGCTEYAEAIARGEDNNLFRCERGPLVIRALAAAMQRETARSNPQVHNEIVSKIRNILKRSIQANLGTKNCIECGYENCAECAEAIFNGDVDPEKCRHIDAKAAARIRQILFAAEADAFADTQDASERSPRFVAVVKCQGARAHTHNRFRYVSQPDCRATTVTQYGQAACPYGCLGFGTCVRACPFNALVMDEEAGLPRVLEDRCTACGTCAEVCPKNIIEILPADQYVHVLCRNKDRGKVVRQACEVGCIACGKCEKVCPVEGSAVHVKDNLAEVDLETCTGCGKCVQACPVGCIGDFRKLRKEAEKRADANAA